MIINTDERDRLVGVLENLELVASGLPVNSSTKDALYRNAATLRAVLTAAVVSRSGRVDGHPC